MITNWHGQIRGANQRAARVTGYDLDTLREMSIDLLHELDLVQITEDLARLGLDKSLTYESCLRTKQEREIPVEVYARQVDIDGTQRLQWMFRDITERKRLEQLREDLTFMIYHDLRAPLANVTYSLDALVQMLGEKPDDSIASVIEIATRSTARIQRLTNSLLDVQKLESGQAVTALERVTVKALMEEAVQSVHSIAELKNQELLLEVDENLPKVDVDPEMISRVIINLIENAIKFSTGPGKIGLKARRQNGWVHISVEDHGPGIPVEAQDTIFDKFSRSSSDTQGFGLGLAFSRLALEAHGGRIWVESIPGEGATFTFALPVSPA